MAISRNRFGCFKWPLAVLGVLAVAWGAAPTAAQKPEMIKITYTKEMDLRAREIRTHSAACTHGQAISSGFVFEVPFPKNPAQFGPSMDVRLNHSHAVRSGSWAHVFENASNGTVTGRAVVTLICWTGSLEEKRY